MESIIKIEFLEILGKKVNSNLILTNPPLPELTKKTTAILCENIEKYFKDKKIKVRTSFKFEK